MRHLEGQFVHLNDGTKISEHVRSTFIMHMGRQNLLTFSLKLNFYSADNLEVYLKYKLKDDQNFIQNLDQIIDECHLEFDGSLIHKYIFIMVSLVSSKI